MSNLPGDFPTFQRHSSSDSDHSFVLLSSPFNDKKRIIILDWDDTILPTSFLLHNPCMLRTPYHELPNELRENLQALEIIVLDLILKLIKLDNCHCYIVSNAMRNWILFSCQTYFPTLFGRLFSDLNPSNQMNSQRPMYGENSSLMVYSACELFARQCPNQRGLWKLFTFTYIADSKLLVPEHERQSQLHLNSTNKLVTRFNSKITTMSTQTKWTKSDIPRHENSKSKSQSVSVNDTVSYQEEEEEEGRGVDQEVIAHEEFDDDNTLPPLFENELEDSFDQFDLEGKDNILLNSMLEKSEWELVSIGDAEHEATAALQIGCTVNSHPNLYRSVTTKVVKMPRLACVAGMAKQLRLLQSSLSKLLACEYSIFVDSFDALLDEK